MRLLFVIFSNVFKTEGGHIDDEYEAADFINRYIKNSTAFVLTIRRTDTEQDCTGLQGSSSFYEFRYEWRTILFKLFLITIFSFFHTSLLVKKEKHLPGSLPAAAKLAWPKNLTSASIKNLLASLNQDLCLHLKCTGSKLDTLM